LLAFRNFRSNGSSANYEEYEIAERNLSYTCKAKKIDSWQRYCATMTYKSRLTDIWKMTKRLRGSRAPTVTDRNPDSWLPDFASRIAPDFVPTQSNLPIGEDLLRYSWLSEEFDLEAPALGHCSISAPGLDGLKFTFFKRLPEEGKRCLLGSFNEILLTAEIPDSWKLFRYWSLERTLNFLNRIDP
jgi:hypothetical protein